MNNLKPVVAQGRLRWLTLLGSLALYASLLPQGPGAVRAMRELSPATTGATFTVTNTADSGAGSLRQAIIDANSNPGLDTISFNISGASRSIAPIQQLPTVSDPVVIDGTTQPGFAGTPIIEINGTAPVQGAGLFLSAGNSTLRGLVINRFHFPAILLGEPGGNRVEGCYIGTDVSGTVALGNSAGILISSSNNVIGGTTAATRNVISGNTNAGIEINQFCCTGTNPTASGNVVQGNFIGTNATGTAAIPNLRQGITISAASDASASGNVIGGTQPGAGNVISGNKSEGIFLGSFQTTGNIVQGNFIGTDVTGSFAVSNGADGVKIDVARNNIIGGSNPNARNVISGNGFNGSGSGGGNGVTVMSSGNVVQGNLIGTNAAGTAPITNLLNGIAVAGTNNSIGGAAAGEGNVIAFNGFDGIRCADPAALGHSFRGNAIFSNGSLASSQGTLGINLGGSGPTANDSGDGDTGSNGLQNFPVITSATADANSVRLQGTLNSSASTSYSLDFYANNVCDSLGFGEGARFIGSGVVATDPGGNGAFDLTFMVSLPANQIFTSTATSPTGNTSEFSQCFPSSPAVGSVAFSSIFLNVIEGPNSEPSFTVNRTGGTAGSLTVNYVVAGITATSGLDFTATQGTLIFADGETSRSFTLPVIDDSLSEADETALVSLTTSGPLDTLGSQSFVKLTIVDNDPLPKLSINDISVNEPSNGTANATFTVSLSPVSGQKATVFYSTAAGTATAGSDYETVSGTLTFNPGETSKPVNVVVNSDAQSEPSETFFVNLSFADDASILDNQGQATIIDASQQSLVRFSSANYNTTESSGSTTITVERVGDTTAAVTVNYFTAQDSLTVQPCDFINGVATPRCDYTTAVGTLHFAAGETSKTFLVLISQDNYVEGPETLTVALSNPTGGAAVATPFTATLTIADDAAEPATNPIDDAENFVRQHYHDFLNREPDAAGLAFWSNQITECQQPGATCNADERRINVSAAFFLSIEFQETGYLVERLYKSAYGDAQGTSNFGPPHPLLVPVVRFFEFLPDAQQIGKDVVVGVGDWQAKLEANKVVFTQEFVVRTRFTTAFPTTLTPAQFVDALFANAGVTPSAAERASVIGEFDGAGNTADTAARAIALRRVAENSTLADQEKNKAFVLMQYYGYLRRDPDASPDSDYSGYDFWLTKLNQFNGNFVEAEMVKAFITSGEYRARFGP